MRISEENKERRGDDKGGGGKTRKEKGHCVLKGEMGKIRRRQKNMGRKEEFWGKKGTVEGKRIKE